jgi:predicted membrane-bound spermidine synthase
VPIALLGAVPPLVLHAVGNRIGRLDVELGRLSGRLSAAGTLGSLVGTLAAGLVLIPWVGTTRTMDIGALALAAAAAVLAVRAQRQLVLPGVTIVVTVALAASVAAARHVPIGRLVHAAESRHNYITVVDVGPERQLRVNDGFAVQSWVYRDGRLPLRDVWSFYALAPAWTTQPVKRVLLLGMGGGTSAELYRRLYPAARVTGVELDPEMVRAGRDHLGIRLDDIEVVIADARTFVARAAVATPAQWDIIILDAFQFPYVPFQLTTQEFFADASRCLAPGGVLVVNAGRRHHHRDVVHALERTLASVFAHVAAADAPNPSNTIIVAGAHDPLAGVGVEALAASSPLGTTLVEEAGRLPRLQPARWPRGTPLLTDDHAPVEWLTDRIIWSSL